MFTKMEKLEELDKMCYEELVCAWSTAYKAHTKSDQFRYMFLDTCHDMTTVMHSEMSRRDAIYYVLSPMNKFFKDFKLKHVSTSLVSTTVEPIPMNVIKASIISLRKRKTVAEYVDRIGRYQILKSFTSSKASHTLLTGLVFDLVYIGSCWNNQSIIVLIEGSMP